MINTYRVGYFTDTHVRADSPENRNDDYRKAILTKLEEIGDIFVKEKVDVILFGGDLYDGPEPANSVVTDVQNILSSWQKRIIGVVGSHDYIGYQMTTLKRTALGIACSAKGLIEIVGGEGFPEYIELGNNIVVTGVPHTYWFADDVKNNYRPRYIEGSTQIQLTHGDLVDIPVPWSHLLIDNAGTESDLVLSGHYHPGWKGVKKKKFVIGAHLQEVMFYNPGAIARLSRTSIVRMPKVAIIDITPEIKVREVYLKSANATPFKETEEVQECENSMQDLENLLTMIESSTTTSAIDIRERIHQVAKIKEIEKDVVDMAFDYLDRAEKEAEV
jgi:DNA repair exonuclease SbcCD nuclease subunit